MNGYLNVAGGHESSVEEGKGHASNNMVKYVSDKMGNNNPIIFVKKFNFNSG